MYDSIKFIKEYIVDFSTIVSTFLVKSNRPGMFEIISEKDVNPGDLLGITYFNHDSFVTAKQIKKQFPDNKLIVGGIGVLAHYSRLLEVADYVYLGEAIPFDPKYVISKNELGGSREVSQEIDFKRVPIALQTGAKSFYLLAEKGCPWGCSYCYVSAVNKFRIIDNETFRRNVAKIESQIKGQHITVLSNEGIIRERNKDIFEKKLKNSYENQSITLELYLANYDLFKRQSIVRFGIELPTEETRAANMPKIKQLKDAQLIELVKDKPLNIVTMFFVWNFVGVSQAEYAHLFEILKHKRPDFILRASFTTLEIQPYTPLVSRLSEHIKQLFETPDFDDSLLYKKIKNITRIKIFKPKKNVNILHLYFFSFLPKRYEFTQPRQGETTLEYYKRTQALNNGADLIEIMQRRALKMTFEKKTTLALLND
jgi:hypothetical protein